MMPRPFLELQEANCSGPVKVSAPDTIDWSLAYFASKAFYDDLYAYLVPFTGSSSGLVRVDLADWSAVETLSTSPWDVR